MRTLGVVFSHERDVGARPVGVFVVDDSARFLRAVGPVIAAVPRFVLVGTATSGEEALEALEAIADRTDVGLLLVDVHLPGISGIEVVRRYREGDGRAVVVLMSTGDPVDLSRWHLEADVAGFLSKETLSTGTLTRLWEEAATRG